jgi:pumilio family protein 6
LYPNIEDYIIDWATGSSSFVILSLTEASNFSKKDDLMRILKENKKKLHKATKEETPEQKARKEAAVAEKDVVKGKGKKSKTVKVIEVGNKGSALLLEKL